jgi:hypothetical protein
MFNLLNRIIRKNLLQLMGVMLCVVLILTCSCHGVGSGNDGRVRIDPNLSEHDVRVKLLQYTPLGASEALVVNFANNQLKHGHGEPAFNRPDTLIVLLGSSARLLGSDNTWVQWRFDSKHKLIQIDVIKSRDTL